MNTRPGRLSTHDRRRLERAVQREEKRRKEAADWLCRFCGRTFEVVDGVCAVCEAMPGRGAKLTRRYR